MDDYVKRKSVYDALCEICNGRDMCEHTGQEGCHNVFARIPAADVRENVRGDWVVMPHSNDWVKCSKCNCAMDYIMSSGCNYCPNCGADMRKEKEGGSAR